MSDFVFVEMGANEGDDPIIDGVSLNRLRIEWRAVKIGLRDPHEAITASVWSALIELIKQLEFRDENDVTLFLNELIGEIAEMFVLSEYRTVKQWVFHLFVDLLMIRQKPLVCYDAATCVRILRQFSSFVVDIDVALLDNFLEPFEADDVCDKEKGDYPFLMFLLECACCSQEIISQKARLMIFEIISRHRTSQLHLVPRLMEVVIEYMEFCSGVSPTLLEGCLPAQLLRYFSDTLCMVKNRKAMEWFIQTFHDRVMRPLAVMPRPVPFKTFSVFVREIDHYPTLTAIVENIVDRNGTFAKNILDWMRCWPNEAMKMFENLLNRRCAAVVSAYFFDENIDAHKTTYGFPRLSGTASGDSDPQKLQRKYSIEIFQKFRTANPELPGNTTHVVSVFPFLGELMSNLWELPEETADILFDLCERIAGTGNRNCYSFCFTPGSSLYFEVAHLITTFDQAPENIRPLFASFVWTMSKILEANPEPTS